MKANLGPRRPAPRAEEADEAPTLVETETHDIERAVPADEHVSVEAGETNEAPLPPVFEQ